MPFGKSFGKSQENVSVIREPVAVGLTVDPEADIINEVVRAFHTLGISDIIDKKSNVRDVARTLIRLVGKYLATAPGDIPEGATYTEDDWRAIFKTSKVIVQDPKVNLGIIQDSIKDPKAFMRLIRSLVKNASEDEDPGVIIPLSDYPGVKLF